jgi:hypothetical protein
VARLILSLTADWGDRERESVSQSRADTAVAKTHEFRLKSVNLRLYPRLFFVVLFLVWFATDDFVRRVIGVHCRIRRGRGSVSWDVLSFRISIFLGGRLCGRHDGGGCLKFRWRLVKVNLLLGL